VDDVRGLIRSSGRQQIEGRAVTRLDGSKVTAVERNHHAGAHPFSQGDHGRIRAAKWKVTVALDQICHSLPVVRSRSLDLQAGNSAKKGGFGAGSESRPNEVGCLGDDHRRNYELEITPPQDIDTTIVVCVIEVGGGV
jgi:hypothetical protein